MPWIISSRRFAVWALLLVASLSLDACAAGSATKNEPAKAHTTGGTAWEASGLEPERTVGGETSLGRACDPDAPPDEIQVDTPLAFADETKLVAVSDNVFVGRVIMRVEDAPLAEKQPLPTTSFSVKVQENIKGSLSGTVTVVQAGGCDPKYGRVALINDDPLLKTSEEAVFSTSKDSAGESYSLVAHKRSHAMFRTEEQEARVVARFREAIRRDG